MRFIVLMLAIAAPVAADDQAKKLIDAIDSLQGQPEDFRCEFEGAVETASQPVPGYPVAQGAQRDSFSGMFLWKKIGSFWCDSFHEDPRRSRKIERRTMVMQIQDNHAEEYRRFDDVVAGLQTFGAPKVFRAQPNFEGPQSLLLLEDLKDQVRNVTNNSSVHDDQIDGRKLKVLEISVKGVDQVKRRYWIDLARDGHVVRFEAYSTGQQIRLRRDIKLASFRVGGAEIWMPVSAEQATFFPPSASETGESQPESRATISILNGTTAFNVRLDATKFAIGYRPGKPTSADGLRRSDQFDRQMLAAEKLEAVVKKAREDLLAQEAEPTPTPAPVPEEVIQPASYSGLRFIAYCFAAVAVVVVIKVWVSRRLRERVL